jgi:hypothetical protein
VKKAFTDITKTEEVVDEVESQARATLTQSERVLKRLREFKAN